MATDLDVKSIGIDTARKIVSDTESDTAPADLPVGAPARIAEPGASVICCPVKLTPPAFAFASVVSSVEFRLIVSAVIATAPPLVAILLLTLTVSPLPSDWMVSAEANRPSMPDNVRVLWPPAPRSTVKDWVGAVNDCVGTPAPANTRSVAPVASVNVADLPAPDRVMVKFAAAGSTNSSPA